jgi:hypothetical protein
MVIRPSYVSDVTAQREIGYDLVTIPAHQAWFDTNILYSYFEHTYPYIRLGYAYGWSSVDSLYGLAKFQIPYGSAVEIAFTCSTEDFVVWLDRQS